MTLQTRVGRSINVPFTVVVDGAPDLSSVPAVTAVNPAVRVGLLPPLLGQQASRIIYVDGKAEAAGANVDVLVLITLSGGAVAVGHRAFVVAVNPAPLPTVDVAVDETQSDDYATPAARS